MPDRNVFDPKPDLLIGRYRHYKGGEYEVLTLACNEATHEWLVIYKALYDTRGMPEIWSRTYEDFTEKVIVDGREQNRFEKLVEASA